MSVMLFLEADAQSTVDETTSCDSSAPETRLENIVREIKELKNLISPAPVKYDAWEPSKQALVSALVCEYLVCF